SDSDVEKDQRNSNELMADLIAEYHKRALLANQKRVNLENESLKDEIIDLKKEPLPPLLKLIRATPYGTSERVISLSDLTLNMANLTLDTLNPKRTRPSVKVSPAYAPLHQAHSQVVLKHPSKRPGLDHVSTVDLGIISMMIATQSPSALLVDLVTI
nr:hypothetical protein [Tanacetum cinerariifolium]